MAESTELENRIAPQAPHSSAPQAPLSAWAKIKLGIHRSVFWSYERGTWQYDLIVAVILAFIFLTPRAWFQKIPNLGMVDLRHVQGVVEVGRDKATQTYMVDARLVQSRAPEPAEDAVREILQERLRKQYRVLSIKPVQDQNGVILSYRVTVAE
jgi:hypothetical protein